MTSTPEQILLYKRTKKKKKTTFESYHATHEYNIGENDNDYDRE